MVLFGESGGQYHASTGPTPPGIWLTSSNAPVITNSAPVGRSTTYAYTGQNGYFVTPNLGTANYAGLIAGQAVYISSGTGLIILGFRDSLGNLQCELRGDNSNQLYFTQNGVTIGSSLSTKTFAFNTWMYVEFRAIFSNSGAGTCEVRVNNVVWLTVTSCTNASNTNGGAQAIYGIPGSGVNGFLRDMYCVDTTVGLHTTYLGDSNVSELYPDGPGTNSAWATYSGTTATATGPLTLTSVNTSGVYQGTITGGASNAYVGYNFNITGFTNGGNNLTAATCTASSSTSLSFTATTISETHAGSATFQNPVQIGINSTGTRPNGDALYIADSNTGDISDFAHQPLTLTGTIAAAIHLTYARKDDAGARQIAQVTVEGGSVTETGTTIALGNSYQYYADVLEADPNTSAAWTLSNLNSATFGVKLIS